MKSILFALFAFAISTQAAENKPVYYFSCPVKEGQTLVTVKFAIQGLNPNQSKGDLVLYPGADEDQGLILIDPVEKRDGLTKMSNLNGQGGDLTLKKNGDIFLFGDGDGYQFTDLVLWWDASDIEEVNSMEGYVRDYGSAYSEGQETFKQFIKCQVSTKVL